MLAVLALSTVGTPPATAAPGLNPSVVHPAEVGTSLGPRLLDLSRGASPSTDAAAASSEARRLRRQVAALLQGYLDDYGDRFTPAEITELLAYKANADRQLAGVVVTTKRLKRLIAIGAPKATTRSAGRAAQTSWRRARTTADATWEGARRIMEPRLSLFEQIGALRDYNATSGRFDDLGATISAVVKATG